MKRIMAFKMTTAQRAHRDGLAREFLNEFPAKYNAGQREHGGELWRKPLAGEMVKEALDFYAYAKTIEQQHREIHLLVSLIKPKTDKERAAVALIKRLTK